MESQRFCSDAFGFGNGTQFESDFDDDAQCALVADEEFHQS